jgi:hypothetical protein
LAELTAGVFAGFAPVVTDAGNHVAFVDVAGVVCFDNFGAWGAS